MQYLRDHLHFIDIMRDRQEADVFIQLTDLRTGSGGSEYTMRILGQGRFDGVRDTIIFYTDADATDNIERNAILNGIKRAILPFLIRTHVAEQLEYSVPANDDNTSVEVDETDPWNYWVFRVNGNFSFSGEESFKDFGVWSWLSASRTTEASKFSLSFNHSYNRSEFQLGDDEPFISTITSAGGSIRYVKSLNDHWSAGFVSGASQSTFSNIDFSARLRPAIEYSIYPYEEATQRQFTVTYAIGPVYNDYGDTTVLDKLDEVIIQQSIDVGMTQVEDWGNLSLDLSVRNYISDLDFTSVTLRPSIEWNVAKGLNLRFRGGVSYIGDLINIPKASINEEDILLRNRQLDTNFDYWVSFGVGYRFGSSVNNVVNTRFNEFGG